MEPDVRRRQVLLRGHVRCRERQRERTEREQPLDEVLRRRNRNFGMQNRGNGGTRHGLNVCAPRRRVLPHSGRDFLAGRRLISRA